MTSADTCLRRELTLAVPDDGAGPVLHAVVYVPRQAVAGSEPAPLAVCLHGLGESGLRVAPVARALAREGMVAVCPSMRGGGSPTAGRTTTMSPLTQIADVRALVGAAGAWPFVDSTRIALFGRSQGGLVAALAAARMPAAIAAAALWYPALAIPGSVRAQFTSRSRIPQVFTRRVEGGRINLGRRYAEDVWDLDVAGELRGLKAPVLIVHGTEDRDVPLAVSRQAVTWPADARLVPVAGAGHGFDGDHFGTAMGALTQFLAWNGLIDAVGQPPGRGR